MVSFVKFVLTAGLLLVCFVMYAQQAVIATPLLEEQYNNFEKRRIEANARTSIPLFRGSNLGIFVRKRPQISFPEHVVIRKETRSIENNDDNILTELLYNGEHIQRRFDDYSENPGPMFG